MTDSVTTSPQQIQYAPRERPARRFVRRYSVTALILVTIASTYWWGPPAWYRAQVLYWHGRCLDYTAPPQSVVAGIPMPKVIPNEWVRFYSLISPPGLLSKGTVFLHERQRPNGNRVLVGIDLTGPASWPDCPLLCVRVFTSGGGFELPHQIQDDATFAEARGPRDRTKFRFYAGQPDANDPTHFVLKYEFDGATKYIDGWVRDQRVDLEQRATNPPPPTSQALSPTGGSPAH